MKSRYLVLAIVCLTTFFTSCKESWPYSEEAYNNVWISAYPSYISLNENEFSGDFTISSSDSWYIYDTPYWVNISGSSYGSGYRNVSFTVDENNGSSKRYGDIKIRTNGSFTKGVELQIAQPPTAQFEVDMPTTNYSASGDWWYLKIKASSLTSWTITKSDSWVHLGNSYSSSYSYSGKGSESVKIYVDANPYSNSRSSKLVVKCGTKTKSINITQDGKYSRTPFEITSIEVGNVNHDFEFINNYGSAIYSYQTQYLTPRIYVNVYTPGTYAVYVKLYDSYGRLVTGQSSPSGYSYNQNIELSSSTKYKNLMGWGGRTSGHYSAGQYKFEIYYNGNKIGEKSFRIY